MATETSPARGGLRIWHRAPAKKWTEALPVGNGRLGAMVYGGVFHNTKLNDRIQLNVDTLWCRSEAGDRIEIIVYAVFQDLNQRRARHVCHEFKTQHKVA